MSLNTLEIIAILMIVLAIAKIIILYTKPSLWLDNVKKIYANPQLVAPISLLLALMLLFVLVNAGVTIVEILVIGVLVGLLMMAGLAPFLPDLFAWIEKQDMRQLMKTMWLYTLVWSVLLLWGVIAILRS